MVSFFTDLESAGTAASAGGGHGKQSRKPDPESAPRGFEIPEMTRRRVVSCGLASTNQNGIGRWLPLIQAFKMVFTPHCLTSSGKTAPTKTRGRRPRNVLILFESVF